MEIKTVGECFYQIRNGANIKQGTVPGGYPITRIETIANDKFNRDRMGYAGITNLSKYESYVLEDGDLLMSHINSVQYLGRTVLYQKLKGETVIHGMNLLGLKANREILIPAYARYYFYSPHFREQLSRITKKSVNQASFTVADLKKIKMRVLSLDDQASIVDILDRVKKLIEKRNDELSNLDALIKARFVEMFGDPIMNTRSMPIKAFSNCCIDMHQGINTVADKVEYQLEGYPIIQSKNITRGYLDLEDVRYLNCDDYEKYKEKYNPKPNDLLVCNIGTIGKTLIVTETKEFLIAWNLFLIKIDQAVINHHYIKTLLELINEKHYFDRFLTGGTVKFINKKTMGAIPTMIPPMEQQEQFSSFVEQVDKSKVAIQKSLDETQLLFDSLMQEYFG